MKTNTRIFPARELAAIGALAVMLSLAALGAEPPKETTAVPGVAAADSPKKDPAVSGNTSTGAADSDTATAQNPLARAAEKKGVTTGGLDPHGDSWVSIRNSFQQFARPAFMLRLFLGLMLAAGCACTIAWRPRSLLRIAPQLDFEERKTLIILGVAGAIIAELSQTNATLAFVIFGVGALVRFRTVLDDPKATGKAILAVVIGLACGMGSWTMAVFVTAFSWVLLLVLDSRVTCNMTIRLDGGADSKGLQTTVQSLLAAHHCHVQDCTLSKSKKRLEFVFNMPARIDRHLLEADVKAKLPRNSNSQISIDVV